MIYGRWSVTVRDRPVLLSALLELVGALLVVAGLALVWLPLGLCAAGAVMVLSAAALERAGATAESPAGRGR